MITAGDYRIGYSLEVTNSKKDKGTEIRVQIDDSNTVAETTKGKVFEENTYETISGFIVFTFTSGVHTIDIDFRSVDASGNDSGGSQVKIRRARLELYAIPVIP